LVQHLNWEFQSPDIDEKSIRCDNPFELPLLIAKAKAAVFEPQEALLVTADQIVLFDGTVREKPHDEQQAREFLLSYSKRFAQTINAIVVTNLKTGEQVSNVDVATVAFDEITPSIIVESIRRGDCFSNAGGLDPALYTVVQGEPTSVLGMNMRVLKEMINITYNNGDVHIRL
jgi:septum formation protein